MISEIQQRVRFQEALYALNSVVLRHAVYKERYEKLDKWKHKFVYIFQKGYYVETFRNSDFVHHGIDQKKFSFVSILRSINSHDNVCKDYVVSVFCKLSKILSYLVQNRFVSTISSFTIHKYFRMEKYWNLKFYFWKGLQDTASRKNTIILSNKLMSCYLLRKKYIFFVNSCKCFHHYACYFLSIVFG